MVPPWMIASCFLAGNTDAELKPTNFSSLILFRVLLSSSECCILRLLLNIYIYIWGAGKSRNWKLETAKIDRNISDLTKILVNVLLGLVRLG